MGLILALYRFIITERGGSFIRDTVFASNKDADFVLALNNSRLVSNDKVGVKVTPR